MFCLQKLPTEVEVKYPLSTQHSELSTGEVAGGNHHLPTSDKMLSRRGFLQAASALGMGSLAGCAERKPTWKKGGYRKPDRSRVAILKAAGYDRDLTSVILDGIKSFRLDVVGKTSPPETKPRGIRARHRHQYPSLRHWCRH